MRVGLVGVAALIALFLPWVAFSNSGELADEVLSVVGRANQGDGPRYQVRLAERKTGLFKASFSVHQAKFFPSTSGDGVPSASDVLVGDLISRQRVCPLSVPSAAKCPFGDLHLDQPGITQNADGTTDIWIQVRYLQPQLYQTTDHGVIRFMVERLHYRFNCATREFVVVQFLTLDAEGDIVSGERPNEAFRAPALSSVADNILLTVCGPS